MKRREFLAGIIPLSITAAVAPGVLLATKNGPRNGPSVGDVYIPRPGTEWTPVFDARCGHGEFRDRAHYLQWLRDQGAPVCSVCDVNHDRAHIQGGRGCYTPDLIARIEQLHQEFGKLNDEVQQQAHRNDDLHDEIGERGNKLGDTNRTWNARVDWLRECLAMSQEWKPDNYQRGFVNALLLAESIMDGDKYSPTFLDRVPE